MFLRNILCDLFSILQILLLLISSSFTKSSTENENNLLTFLNDKIILKNEFSKCSLFYVHGKGKSTYLNLEQLITLTGKELFLVDLYSDFTYRSFKFAFQKRRSTRGFCSISLIFLDHKQNEKVLGLVESNRISDLLIGGYAPVTRRHEDFYIFISNSEDSVKMQVAHKIKYKIFIQTSPAGESNGESNGESLIVRTACVFCKPWRIIQIHHDENLFPDFLNNFELYQVRVSCPTRVFFGIEIERRNGHLRLKRGPYKYTFEALRDRFNFSVQVKASPGGGTGVLFKNNTWNGVMRDIIDSNAEVGLVNGHIYSRHPWVSYTSTVSYEWLTFTTRVPKKFFSWKAIFWSFQYRVWLIVFLTLGLGVATFWTLHNIKKYQNPRVGEWPIDKIIQYVFSSLLEEGLSDPVSTPATKVFCLFWMIFAIVISCAYKSKLVGFLAFPSLIPPPRGFEELASSEFKWGIEGSAIGGAQYEILKSSTNPIYIKIFNQMELVPDPVKCYSKGIRSDFSCIAWQSNSKYMIYKNFSDNFGRTQLNLAPDSSNFISVGIIMEIFAIFKSNFDHYIKNWMTMGLLSNWEIQDYEGLRRARLNWEREINYKNQYQDPPEVIVLKLINFMGAFYIIILGFTISLIVFVGEVTNLNFKKQFQSKLARLKGEMPIIELR